MEKILEKWANFIEADLTAAKDLYTAASKKKKPSQYNWMLVIWHTHQAVEKTLKMLIIYKGKEIHKIHDLPKLLNDTGINNLPEEWEKIIYRLTSYYLPPRYPDTPLKTSCPKSNKETSHKFLKFAEDFYLWSKKSLSLKK